MITKVIKIRGQKRSKFKQYIMRKVEQDMKEYHARIRARKIAQSITPNPVKITTKIKTKARKLAGSSKGLDIKAFRLKYNIYFENVDELLKG